MTFRIPIIFFIFLHTGVLGQFLEESSQSGIEHIHLSVRSLGGGVSFFDYNNDGFLDLYLTGGGTPDKLFLNKGDKTFFDVSDQTEVTKYTEGYQTSAVISGDINNDGCQDLMVTTYDDRRNILLLNDCNGTFRNISFAAGLTEEVLSMGAAFVDINQDGLLDIYVINYVEESRFILNPQDEIIGFDHKCWPNLLYINQGNSEFIESSELFGINNKGCGLAAVTTDFNEDGYTDLYVVNDFGEWVVSNTAFEFDPQSSTFINISEEAALDIGVYGMGVAAGDYDNDLDMDYYITNLGKNQLLENDGQQVFTNVANLKGVENGMDEIGNFYTGWGTFFFDFDNDSDLDLFVSNGFTGAVEFLSPALEDPNRLYENVGGTFIDVTDQYNLGMIYRNRGAAYGDYDNDGDLDFFVVTLNGEEDLYSPLYNNTIDNGNHWVDIHLEGSIANRDAIGAKVTLYFDNSIRIKERYSSGSYASQSSTALHFGLGTSATIDSVEVHWGMGRKEVFYAIPIDQKVFIKEGEATVEVMGCTDSSNVYYNELATYNTGCKKAYIVGCMDPDALNYNSRANLSGDCTYEEVITGNESLLDISFKLYPNPSNQFLNINFPGSLKGYSIELYTLFGYEVYSKSDIFAEEFQIDISHLPAGVYVMQVRNNGASLIKKFLKD